MSLLEAVSFPALGTTATVVAPSPAARAVVEDEIAVVDAACSRFRADSDLSRVNACAGEWVPVAPALIAAIDVALRAARATGGLVDPTVGGSLRVLGYDRSFADVPGDGGPLRVTVGPAPGWQVIDVDRAGGRVRIPAGVSLDLGATAKAWCADRAAARASAAVGAGVLVSLGGDIAVAGEAPEGGWSVRVTDDHAGPADAPGQTVAIRSGGLATSGTSVRRWARGGARLHHLIDPATGRPADGGWRTASVAAATCVDANTASTAAIVLGPGAVAWLARHGLPARLVAVDGAVTTVGEWPCA